MTLAALAPAKINRELRVGRRGPDGYHEVFSRMVSIDLADRLLVERCPGLEFSCDDPAVPLGEENLVVRAARALAGAAGIEPAARIRLEKRVPMGGGLGGGSADAAVALRVLARLWELDVSEGRFAEIAASLGSDVPFFLSGGQADVRGRGEIVTPVADAPPTALLLVVPPFRISTRDVYERYAGRGTLPGGLDIDRPGWGRFLGPDDLTGAVLEMEPGMEAYLESAASTTPDHALSGSGATIVLHGAGPAAEGELGARHPDARLLRCRTLTRDQYRRQTSPTGGVS
jgi:4-diphosphocytidyl-2-C-methyl-D-erythritol kinase